MMMEAISDSKMRRSVENAISRGLWDQIDDLRPVLEELEEEMEDYHEARRASKRAYTYRIIVYSIDIIDDIYMIIYYILYMRYMYTHASCILE